MNIMEPDKLLTPELKEYYMKDFNENVIHCKDKYWGLDIGLEEILIEINKNKNVQTLYSRKYGKNNFKTDHEGSFVCFAISDKADTKLLDLFYKTCEDKYKEFYVNKRKPETNTSFVFNIESDKLGCVSNDEYFNVSVIQLDMFSHNLKKHIEFWKDIKECLIKV